MNFCIDKYKKDRLHRLRIVVEMMKSLVRKCCSSDSETFNATTFPFCVLFTTFRTPVMQTEVAPKVSDGQDGRDPIQPDVESQVPVYATNVRQVDVVYVQSDDQVYQQDDRNDPWVVCAMCGLLFSWIPIIGCLTFLANMNAPQQSLRAALARAACCVATLIVLFNIIFWSWYN